MDLAARIRAGQGVFALFAITPPRWSTPTERLPGIAQATIDRLSHLDLDGLVLYDIGDETSRNPVERPFPVVHAPLSRAQERIGRLDRG